MDDPTTRLIYDYICSYIEEKGYAPSIREIAAACFVGHSNVDRYLKRLEDEGLIKRGRGVPRGISLID
jgi:repressor LexA